MKPRIQVMWFRRDLRLTDNAALYHALRTGVPVLPLFIFDRNILNQLEDKADRRVEFIHAALTEMQAQLASMGSSLEVYYGFPMDVYKKLTEVYDIETVFTNHDFNTVVFFVNIKRNLLHPNIVLVNISKPAGVKVST